MGKHLLDETAEFKMPVGGRHAAEAEDDLEATIRAYRAERPSCDRCGPRPEADATFCSNCGQYLPGRCEQCGRRVEEAGARFCSACGHHLAA